MAVQLGIFTSLSAYPGQHRLCGGRRYQWVASSRLSLGLYMSHIPMETQVRGGTACLEDSTSPEHPVPLGSC